MAFSCVTSANPILYLARSNCSDKMMMTTMHLSSSNGGISKRNINPGRRKDAYYGLHAAISCSLTDPDQHQQLVQELHIESYHINGVPDQFLVPAHERPALQLAQKKLTLPLIDLSSFSSSSSSSISSSLSHHQLDTLCSLAIACEEWGFFQVINHGIPISVIEGTRQLAKKFFELPMDKKAAYVVKDQSIECLTGYGHTEFFKGSASDWMDSLFGYLAPSSLKRIDMWPSEPKGLRGMVELYGREIEHLFKKLLQLMSKNLGSDPNHLEKAFQDYNLFFRANYYPPCPSPKLVLGTHGHKDHGCLSILLQDKDMDGLQVFKDDEWFSIEPIQNALVVNIGNEMQVLTNGKYKSALHRGVVTNKDTIMTLVAHMDPPERE